MIVFVFMMRNYKGCFQLASFILMFPVHGDVFQVYCSVECRHADWDIHEMFCEQIQVNYILQLSLSMTVFTCGELLGWSFPLGRSYFNPPFFKSSYPIHNNFTIDYNMALTISVQEASRNGENGRYMSKRAVDRFAIKIPWHQHHCIWSSEKPLGI